jgi:methyltransferase-like protein
MPVSLPEKHAGVFVKVAKEKLGQFFSIDRLVAETIAQMEQGRAGRHELRRVLLTAMTDLARGGFLELSRRNPQAKRYNRRYPFRARPTLQYMLKNNFHQLPNLAYELVELPLEIQFLITQMDGRRSDVELAKSFLRWKNHQEGSHRKTLTQREIDSAVQWLSQSVAVLETLGFLESPPPRSLARNVEAA